MTVENWTWLGDPEAPRIIAPLPNEKGKLYQLWFIEVDEAAEREGIETTGRYEGEEQSEGQDYFPSQETIDNLTAFGRQLKRVHERQ